MRKPVSFVALGLLVAALGCASKNINEVMADPYRYADKEVRLTGQVVESYSVAGTGFYRLEDTSGRLWIFSSKGVPRKGSRVQVEGKIKDGFDLTSVTGFFELPEPIRERIESGLLMVASSHKAKS